GFGAVQLGLSALAYKSRPDQPALDGAYLTQGLMLVTVGIIAKVTGPQLALTLALESAVLLTGVRIRHGRIFQISGFIVGLLAFVASFDTVHGGNIVIERFVRGSVA